MDCLQIQVNNSMRQRCYVHGIQHLIHMETDYKVMILALVVLFIDHKKVVLVIDFCISNIFMSMKILIAKNLLLNIKFPTKPKKNHVRNFQSSVCLHFMQFAPIYTSDYFTNISKYPYS